MGRLQTRAQGSGDREDQPGHSTTRWPLRAAGRSSSVLQRRERRP